MSHPQALHDRRDQQCAATGFSFMDNFILPLAVAGLRLTFIKPLNFTMPCSQIDLNLHLHFHTRQIFLHHMLYVVISHIYWFIWCFAFLSHLIWCIQLFFCTVISSWKEKYSMCKVVHSSFKSDSYMVIPSLVAQIFLCSGVVYSTNPSSCGIFASIRGLNRTDRKPTHVFSPLVTWTPSRWISRVPETHLL